MGVWNGNVCRIAVDKTKSTGVEIERHIKKLMQELSIGHSQTVVDSDGMGAYLESYLTGLKEFHGGTPAVNKKEFANLKSECGYKLAGGLCNHRIKPSIQSHALAIGRLHHKARKPWAMWC